MAKQKWKRRQIVVDKEFQFRYLMTWVLLTMSLVGGLVLGSMSVFYFTQAGHMVRYFIWVNAGCAAIITALSMYYIVLHSHRIAGPAFRLQRLIHEIAQGRRGFRVKLRKKDYLTRIADELNVLLEKLEEREAKVNELGRQIAELSSDGRDINHVHDVAGRVSRELQALCPKLEKVKMDGDEEKKE
jgi:methyl-accepting chemotaxis protein